MLLVYSSDDKEIGNAIEVAGMRMLRFSLEVTGKDNKCRHTHIRRTLKVGRFGQKVRQSMLGWCGYVWRLHGQKTDEDAVAKKDRENQKGGHLMW